MAVPVLLVEDDLAVAEPLVAALSREDYDVTACRTGAEALTAIAGGGYQLVVMDLGLPDMDGLRVCREIREHHDQAVPILLLTARAEEIDVVVGLDAGADDYVTKPFRLAELMARMRALVRRGAAPVDIEVGALRVDRAAHRAWLDGTQLELAPKEFELLALLADNAGTVVPRDRIARDVWNAADAGRSIDQHVSVLRRKLAEGPQPVAVTAVRGVGFRLERR